MRNKTIPLLLALVFCTGTLTAELEFGSEFETTFSSGIDKLDIYRKNIRLDLSLAASANETEITATLRGEEDSIRLANPRIFELREAWISRIFLFQGPVNDVTLKAGKIIHTWGNADEFKPCDILNPQDLSYILLKPLQERKKASYSATFSSHLLNNLYVECTLLPDFQPTDTANSSVFIPKQLLELQANPLVTLLPPSLPSDDIIHTTLAVRFGLTFAGIDSHFNYYNGFDHLPSYGTSLLPSATPPFYTLSVKPSHKELVMYGLDLQRSLFAGISTRLEMAWFDKGKHYSLSQAHPNPMLSPYFQDISSGGDGLLEKPTCEYTFGLDVTEFFLSGLYLNLQLNQRIIANWSVSLADEEILTSLIGTLEYSFWNQRISLKARGFYNLEQEASSLGFEIALKLSGSMTMQAGTWLFDGPFNSTYGQFKEKDLMHIGLKANF